MWKRWISEQFIKWNRIRTYEATHDVANIPANSTIAEDITVTGVKVGDEVLTAYRDGSGPYEQIIHNARVTANDTVRAFISNPSTSAYNPASADYVFVVLKYRGDN
jgi:hypothetical protein